VIVARLPRVDDNTLLRCIIFSGRMVAVDTVITVKVFLIGFWMKRLPLA
jgi:hypothetical protein